MKHLYQAGGYVAVGCGREDALHRMELGFCRCQREKGLFDKRVDLPAVCHDIASARPTHHPLDSTGTSMSSGTVPRLIGFFSWMIDGRANTKIPSEESLLGQVVNRQ